VTLPSAEHPAYPAFIEASDALNEAIDLLSAVGEPLAAADCGPTGVLLLTTEERAAMVFTIATAIRRLATALERNVDGMRLLDVT
jgi:hypothetical protein